MIPPRTPEPSPNLHVLIFGKQAGAQELAALLAERINISATTCSTDSPQSVDTTLREGHWDLIVWDCALPVLPTPAAVQRIQILQPDAPILLVADDPTIQETVDLMLMGARGVVTRENTRRLVDLIWQELAPRLEIPANIEEYVGPVYATEQELRRVRARAETSEQILREAQKVAEVGYWELDLEQNMLHWSEDVYAIFGCPPDEFNATYAAFLQFVHPDDREWVDTAYNHHLTTKQPFDIVHRVITRDGKLKYLRERCQTTFDEVGVPLRSLGVMADVTQIKLAEEALRESKAHQNAMLRAIPDLMFSIKTDGTFLDYHAPSDDQLVLPPEMFIGHKVQDVLPPEMARKQLAAIQEVIATQKPVQYEYTLTHQGQEREYEARLVPVNGDEMLAIVRDVTEQRRLSAALRVREEQYRSLIEGTDAAISLIDGDGRCLYLNPIAALPYGKKPEELIGSFVSDLFPPRDATRILAEVHQVIRSGKGMDLESESIIEGESRWFRVSVQPVRNATGAPYAGLISASDITDKKLAEREILIQNAILRESNDLIALANATGEIVYMNQGGAKLLGHTNPGIFIGRHISTFHLPEDADRVLQEYLPESMRTGHVRFENRLQTNNGELIDVDQTIFPIRDSDGQIIHMATIISDIRKRKKALRALQEAHDQLEKRVQEGTQALKEERSLLRIVSQVAPDLLKIADRQDWPTQDNIDNDHGTGVQETDLHAPLALIQVATEVLRQRWDNLTNEHKQRQIPRIDSAIRELTDLLNDMQSLDKVENNDKSQPGVAPD